MAIKENFVLSLRSFHLDQDDSGRARWREEINIDSSWLQPALHPTKRASGSLNIT